MWYKHGKFSYSQRSTVLSFRYEFIVRWVLAPSYKDEICDRDYIFSTWEACHVGSAWSCLSAYGWPNLHGLAQWSLLIANIDCTTSACNNYTMATWMNQCIVECWLNVLVWVCECKWFLSDFDSLVLNLHAIVAPVIARFIEEQLIAF